MTDDDEHVEVRAVVASTHRLEKYGGRFRLTPDELQLMLDQIRNGKVSYTESHDPNATRPVELLDASVEDAGDGELQLVSRLRYRKDDWQAWIARVGSAGAPGGVSYTAFRSFAERGDSGQASIMLAADAASFTQEVILAATNAIDTDAYVRSAELVEFSPVAVCRIIIVMAQHQDVLQQWGPAVVAVLVLPALRQLAKAGKWIRYQLRFERPGRRLDAVIETAELSGLQEAMSKAENLESFWETDGDPVILTFDPDRKEWVDRRGATYRPDPAD